MFRFDTLDSVRSCAREKALESEEYFYERICGGRGFDRARARWIWSQVVAQKKVPSPSETFNWLFPELVLERSSYAA